MNLPRTIIIAPHADDELIGCYSILCSKSVTDVLFASSLAIKESEASALFFGFQSGSVSDVRAYMEKGFLFFFPDPYFETHPKHRELGSMGELMARSGERVTFYSVNMMAPYIEEVVTPEDKLRTMNILYPEKKALWEYNHKYFLFEGYSLWLFHTQTK